MKHILFLVFLSLSIGLNAQTNNNLSMVDHRALSYYSQAEIMAMDALKIAQLNFIYRSSYVLNTEKPCPMCPEVDLNAFDVDQYLRELKSRKRVYITNPGIPIDILSVQELDVELERIKNEFQSTIQQH